MPVGKPFIQLLKVDSTNNYAMAQVQAALAEPGTAWFANEQTNGKGQRGKSWFSKPGENIILSFAIDPLPLKIDTQFVLSAIVALSCAELLSRHSHEIVKIKWPNDLYFKDRKAGGILIENVLQGHQWKFAVVGVGININQTEFEHELTNVTSLKLITGKVFDAPTLANELCDIFNRRWADINGGEYTEVLNEYQRNMYRLNDKVTFIYEEAVFSARVRGIDVGGHLILDAGQELKLPIGSVKWQMP